MGDQLSAQSAALWTNQVALLLDAGNHGEVEWEVCGDDAADSLLLELLVAFQVWAVGGEQKRFSLRPSRRGDMTQTGTPTFVHAIQDGFQHILSIAVAVFLPHRAVFTAEDDEFTIASGQ